MILPFCMSGPYQHFLIVQNSITTSYEPFARTTRCLSFASAMSGRISPAAGFASVLEDRTKVPPWMRYEQPRLIIANRPIAPGPNPFQSPVRWISRVSKRLKRHFITPKAAFPRSKSKIWRVIFSNSGGTSSLSTWSVSTIGSSRS